MPAAVAAVVQRASAPVLVPRVRRRLTAAAQELALAPQLRAAVYVAPARRDSAAPVMADLHSLRAVPVLAPGQRVVPVPAVYQPVAAVRSPQSAAVRLASTLPPEQQTR